ncbi:acetyl-CoA synthetase-like protein [Martensiomyces pterosporus]|nr:acetyl-CoA synthetase-like protein [Martensiomyces pterosporus]
MVFKSPFPDVDVPSVDIPTFLFEYARKHTVYGKNPNLPILIDETATLTFADLEEISTSFASGLVNNAEFQRGDILAIVLPNTSYYPVIALGTQMVGGTVTTANPAYTARELAHQLKLTQAKYVVTLQTTVPTVKEALRIAGMTVPDKRIFTIDGTNSILDILSSKPFTRIRLTTREQAANTPSFIVFSSGTSGQPKGVVLSHRNIVSNVLQSIEFDKADKIIKAADKNIAHQAWMCVLPMFHIYGMTVIMLLSIAKGAHLIILRSFNLEKFVSLSEKHKASVAHLSPPVILRLAKDPVVSKYDLSSFVYVNSGSAPLSKELQLEAEARIRADITQGYGLSETSPTTHRSLMATKVFGSIGSLFSSMECKILDDGGNELGVNQVGEICLRGPNIMMGYLKNPQATAEAIDEDEFLHTGDIGYVDENGHYYVTDRKKELIKYKGFQVAPAELEGLLTDHPAVIDSAVIPVYDESRASEIPKAFVVIRPEMDTPGIAEEVRVWLDSRVIQYKRLRGGVEVIGAIPKSVSGKILRRVLKEREAKKRKLKANL